MNYSKFLFFLLRALPLRLTTSALGFLTPRIISTSAGSRRRIRENLSIALPDIDEAERRRIENGVLASIAVTSAELFSGRRFVKQVKGAPLEGPGVAALLDALQQRQPVFLVTGHIGNYDALRASLISKGFPVAGLYRPMNHAGFNAAYVQAISEIGQPLFPKSRQGLADMVKFLKNGGMVGVVLDQAFRNGAELKFFDQPALTSTAIASLAIRHGALVIPCYGLRQTGGTFRLTFEEPIEHSDPVTMTQQLNDSLEQVVRAHPEQWLWTHRRWKL